MMLDEIKFCGIIIKYYCVIFAIFLGQCCSSVPMQFTWSESSGSHVEIFLSVSKNFQAT